MKLICYKCSVIKYLGELEEDAEGRKEMQCECGGEFEKALTCEICGKVESEEEYSFCINEVCDSCVYEHLTLDEMKTYLKEKQLETDFYIENFINEDLNNRRGLRGLFYTDKLLKMCKDEFNRQVSLYKLTNNEKEIIGKMKEYIETELESFALYLIKKYRGGN